MGYVKVYKYKKQCSLDGGVTWQDVTPAEYVPSGDPIGTYDTLEECEMKKLILTLNDSSTVNIECDSTSSISQSEVSTYAGSAVSVEIKECATSIGMTAFDGFNGLTSITIPNNISTIGMFAFSNCQNLSSCTLNYGVTSIGNYAFYNCSNLSSIVIPDSVTFLGSAVFDACTSLSSVTLPNNVTSINIGTFRGCTSLTGITIPNSVTNIYEQSFSACTSLTEITIPSGVTNIGYDAFWGCSGLTSITCLATTPPTLGSNTFDNTGNCPIYVPCDSLSVYQSAWSAYASRLQCITRQKKYLFEGSQSFGQWQLARFSKSEGFLQVAFEHNANGYLDYLYVNNEPLYVEFSSVPNSGTVRIQNGWWSKTYDAAAPVSTSEPLEIYITGNTMYNDIYQHDLALVDNTGGSFTITSVYYYE